MNWKPIFKPREKASTNGPLRGERGTAQDKKTKADWLDQVVVRLATEADLPGMEWDGEFAHFRRVYAEAYQRMERGYTLLWVAELLDANLASQVLNAPERDANLASQVLNAPERDANLASQHISTTSLLGQVFIQMVCDRPELADGIERAYLYSFRVRSQLRGQGLGSLIMDVVEDDLRQRGFQYVTLNVARDNPRAQKLYQRRGYRVVAPEPGVWSYPDEHGVWHQVEEPAWRMEKVL